MAKCKNPECKEGLTPGIVVKGKGNKNMPVLGQTMRWGWVRCLACNRSEDQVKHNVQYKHVVRSAEEIAMRGRLADSKADYKPAQATLGKVRAGVAESAAPPAPAPSANSEQLTKLLDQVGKLTEQVTELLAENRELRKELKATKQTPAEVAA